MLDNFILSDILSDRTQFCLNDPFDSSQLCMLEDDEIIYNNGTHGLEYPLVNAEYKIIRYADFGTIGIYSLNNKNLLTFRPKTLLHFLMILESLIIK